MSQDTRIQVCVRTDKLLMNVRASLIVVRARGHEATRGAPGRPTRNGNARVSRRAGKPKTDPWRRGSYGFTLLLT